MTHFLAFSTPYGNPFTSISCEGSHLAPQEPGTPGHAEFMQAVRPKVTLPTDQLVNALNEQVMHFCVYFNALQTFLMYFFLTACCKLQSLVCFCKKTTVSCS